MPRHANTKKKKQCHICQEVPRKYTCPRDQVGYCSVACFALHKQQTNCPGTRLLPPILPSEAPIQSDSLPISNIRPDIQESIKEPVPVRSLEDLHWPPELEDHQSAVFYDPLRRDEVKPLRKFEWEAIATSPDLRALLASAPSNFRELFQKVSMQPDIGQRHRLVEQLLGLQPSQPRLGHQHPHHSKRPPFLVANHEQKLFAPFAELVKDILDTARGSA